MHSNNVTTENRANVQISIQAEEQNRAQSPAQQQIQILAPLLENPSSDVAITPDRITLLTNSPASARSSSRSSPAGSSPIRKENPCARITLIREKEDNCWEKNGGYNELASKEENGVFESKFICNKLRADVGRDGKKEHNILTTEVNGTSYELTSKRSQEEDPVDPEAILKPIRGWVQQEYPYLNEKEQEQETMRLAAWHLQLSYTLGAEIVCTELLPPELFIKIAIEDEVRVKTLELKTGESPSIQSIRAFNFKDRNTKKLFFTFKSSRRSISKGTETPSFIPIVK